MTEAEARKMLALLMLDAQEEALLANDPEGADPELEAWAAIARDPEQAAELLDGADVEERDEMSDQIDLALEASAGSAQKRAPKGGIVLQGRFYIGGQYIPSEVLASLTPEERADVEEGRGLTSPPRQSASGQPPQAGTGGSADGPSGGGGGEHGVPIAAWALFGAEPDTLEAVFLQEQAQEDGQKLYRWVARRDSSGALRQGEWGNKEEAVRGGRDHARQAMG